MVPMQYLLFHLISTLIVELLVRTIRNYHLNVKNGQISVISYGSTNKFILYIKIMYLQKDGWMIWLVDIWLNELRKTVSREIKFSTHKSSAQTTTVFWSLYMYFFWLYDLKCKSSKSFRNSVRDVKNRYSHIYFPMTIWLYYVLVYKTID